MLINEVCQKCFLTRKAVEYYTEQGLVAPHIQENGYRSFSEDDVILLKKISVLRNLGLSVADIRIVLSDQAVSALKKIADRKSLEMGILQEKQKLIQELSANHDWDQVDSRLRQIEKKQSILERLLNVFPGYYGRYICAHFAIYLGDPIVTEEQQEAFCTIIDFLDNADFRIPDELQKYLDEVTADWGEDFAGKVAAQMDSAIRDGEKYFTENQKAIEAYLAYKQSEEYRETPAYHLEESLRQFTETSGYNDIFLPAMCRLSNSYREYQEELASLNEKFLQNFCGQSYFC